MHGENFSPISPFFPIFIFHQFLSLIAFFYKPWKYQKTWTEPCKSVFERVVKVVSGRNFWKRFDKVIHKIFSSAKKWLFSGDTMLSTIWYYLQSLKKRVKYLWRSDTFIKVKGVCIFTFFISMTSSASNSWRHYENCYTLIKSWITRVEIGLVKQQYRSLSEKEKTAILQDKIEMDLHNLKPGTKWVERCKCQILKTC